MHYGRRPLLKAHRAVDTHETFQSIKASSQCCHNLFVTSILIDELDFKCVGESASRRSVLPFEGAQVGKLCVAPKTDRKTSLTIVEISKRIIPTLKSSYCVSSYVQK